mmetsp:Transcript_78664/g.244097  ORF Transcript_78664/g.244097 Transcript_78664/m.244097 type:complete len:211 (+) Transcript_78664:378-1010(+)
MHPEVPDGLQAPWRERLVPVDVGGNLHRGVVEDALGVGLLGPEEVPARGELLDDAAVRQDLQRVPPDALLRLLPEHVRGQDAVRDGRREHALVAVAARGVAVQEAFGLGPHAHQELSQVALQSIATIVLAVDEAPELKNERLAVHLQGATRHRCRERGVRAVAVALRLVQVGVEEPLVEPARLQGQQPVPGRPSAGVLRGPVPAAQVCGE